MPDVYTHTTADGKVFALGAKPRPPDPREWKYELLPLTAADRSQPRSMARYFPRDPFDQGAEGSCTANSSIAAQMACAASVGLQPVMLSRMDLYLLERVKEHSFPADNGAFPADSIDCVLENGGLPPESAWPYDAQPAEEAPAGLDQVQRLQYVKGHQPIAGANFIDGAIQALDNGQPLILALTWLERYFNDYEQTAILEGVSTGAVAGGHQIAVWGWTPMQGGMLCCRNSWGASSPARPDLHPDAIAGDVFLPSALFENGIVSEERALIPIQTAPPPAPGPIPGPSARAQVDSLADQAVASLRAQGRTSWLRAGVTWIDWFRKQYVDKNLS